MQEIFIYDIIILYIFISFFIPMENTKIKLLIWIISSFLFLTNSNAFAPLQQVSDISVCDYKIVWNDYTWTAYDSWWLPLEKPWCDNPIDFSSIEDWVYDLYFRAEDSTLTPSSNKMEEVFKWTYKIDTKAPECILNEIDFYWVDNQYYNNWNFYYKSSNDASWKFSLDISCTDWSNAVCDWDTCSSWISEFDFPAILWISNPLVNYTTNTSWTKNFILTYNWSWKHTDTWDLLNNLNFVYDKAGNSSVLKNSNTLVNFRSIDWSELFSQVSNISAFNLSPDSEAPVLWNVEYSVWDDSTNVFASVKTTLFWANTYFSALNNRKIKVPGIVDNISWLKSYSLDIENSDDYSSLDTYNQNLSNSSTRVTSIWEKTFIHDFSDVSENWDYDNNLWYREYTWNLNSTWIDWEKKLNQICDMVWNCKTINNYSFRVVANKLDLTKTTSNKFQVFDDNSVVSNYTDRHNLYFNFKDKYWNEIVPVVWVKEIVLSNTFTNNLWADQIDNPEKWDWVKFDFKNWFEISIENLNDENEFHSFSWILENPIDLAKWQYNIYLSSAIPTFNEYIELKNDNYLYWSYLTNLSLDDLNIKINSKNSYVWVWELDSFGTNLVDASSKIPFKFYPVLTFWIDWLYPIIDWQRKDLELSILNKWVISFLLNTYVVTNNPFLQINNLLFEWKAWFDWYIWIDSNDIFADWASADISFIPKTTWWIQDEDKKIALYSILEYNAWWKNVKLPSIQAWLTYYWVVDEENISYSDDTEIIFSEIDVKWITQTNNELWADDWTNAVSTDNSTYDDFSSLSLLNIKTTITHNVTEILKWQNLASAEIENYTLNSFNFASSSEWLKLQNSDIIYFKWTDLVLDCGLECEIDWNKTIIVEEWTLTIKSNMYYADADSVLWIILIWNTSNGNYSQLRIDERITNWVWVVYSDWPVVSVDSNWTIYDWNNWWAGKLKNQLLWEWSYITRNTVWWSIKSDNWDCPYWTPHYENWCNQEIAQAYDLIYLRRYAVKNNIPLFAPVKITWNRVFDDLWDISWGSSNLTQLDDSSLKSPFILKYDSRIQTNPPYLFEQ